MTISYSSCKNCACAHYVIIHRESYRTLIDRCIDKKTTPKDQRYYRFYRYLRTTDVYQHHWESILKKYQRIDAVRNMMKKRHRFSNKMILYKICKNLGYCYDFLLSHKRSDDRKKFNERWKHIEKEIK